MELRAIRQHPVAIEDIYHLGEERDFATKVAAEGRYAGTPALNLWAKRKPGWLGPKLV
jgi:hypothetical protein